MPNYPAIPFDQNDSFNREAGIAPGGDDSVSMSDAALSTVYQISPKHTAVTESDAGMVMDAWATGEKIDITWRDGHAYQMHFIGKPSRSYPSPGRVTIESTLEGHRV